MYPLNRNIFSLIVILIISIISFIIITCGTSRSEEISKENAAIFKGAIYNQYTTNKETASDAKTFSGTLSPEELDKIRKNNDYYSQFAMQSLEKSLKFNLNLIKDSPDSHTAYLRISEIYLAMGLNKKQLSKEEFNDDYELALLYAKKYCDLTGNNDISYRLAAKVFLYLGKIDLARENIIKSIEIKPDDIENNFLAWKILDANKLSSNYFKKIIIKNIKIPFILSDIGDTYFKNGKYNEALKYYHRSIKLYPEDEVTSYNIANCYYKEKNYKDAISWYDYSIEKNKDFPPAYYNLALAYYSFDPKNSKDKIVDYLEQYIKILKKLENRIEADKANSILDQIKKKLKT